MTGTIPYSGHGSAEAELRAIVADQQRSITDLQRQVQTQSASWQSWWSVWEYARAEGCAIAECKNGGIGIIDQGGSVVHCAPGVHELAEWCRPHNEERTLARHRSASYTKGERAAITYGT